MVMPAQVRKLELIEARLSPEAKQLIEEAARLRGNSMSDFLVNAAQEAARQTVREHRVITMSSRDSRAFVQAILNPPEPNDALRDAVRHYRSVMGTEP